MWSATLNDNILWTNHQSCKNVQRCKQCLCKKNPILGKIFAKCYAVLSRKWVMSRFRAFWWHFFAHFGTLCYFLAFFCTIWVFLAFYAVLSQIRFVVIYALVRVKYFWLKPCLCKKNCLFACLPMCGRRDTVHGDCLTLVWY